MGNTKIMNLTTTLTSLLKLTIGKLIKIGNRDCE